MPNALGEFLSGYQAGDAITSQQRDNRQRNQLMGLAQGVISGDPEAYAQAAAIDPRTANAYSETGDNIARRARGAARFLQSAIRSGNEQGIMAARRTIKPFMDTLRPGSPYPMDMDQQQELAGIEAFLAQTESLDPMFNRGGTFGVQSTYINRDGQRVAVMRDGSQQVLGDADARTQLRDQEGIAPSIVDLRTAQATPLNAQAPSSNLGVYIEPSLPPEVQAQIRQAEATGQQVPGHIQVGQPNQGDITAARTNPNQTLTPYQQAQLDNERARIDLQRQAAERDATPSQRPMPVAALRMLQDARDGLSVTDEVENSMTVILNDLQSGRLTLGPVTNFISRSQNNLNRSTENSRAYDQMVSSLRRMQNQSLRLNKGVQTEGDAQRAWQELMANLNDTKNVIEQLQRIQGLNQRAAILQQENMDAINANYQRETDTPSNSVQPATSGQSQPGGWGIQRVR